MSAETSVTQGYYLDGVQLRVTGTDGDDYLTVRPDAALGIVVTNAADGSFTAFGGAVKTVRVDGGSGHDSILIDGSLALRAFVYGGDGDDVLIGGGGADYLNGGAGTNALDGAGGDDVLVTVGGSVTDRLTGGAGRDSFWLDARKTEAVTDLAPDEALGGSLHRVGSFFSRVRNPAARTALGNVALNVTDLPDPAVYDRNLVYSNFADYPLFGDAGPAPDDVVQGAVGDCYAMVVFSSVAALNPNRIRQSVVDLGDGTFAVQFRRGSARYYVRVDADLPVYPGTQGASGGVGTGGVPGYAALGAQDSLWVAVIEKAHAVVRSPLGGYTGLDGGWMREAYGMLGLKSRSFRTGSADLLMRTIQSLLATGRSVTYATNQSTADMPLLANHAYAVVGVVTDGAGIATGLRLRNPWGNDGAGSDGADDGYVTITASQAQAALVGVCTAAA